MQYPSALYLSIHNMALYTLWKLGRKRFYYSIIIINNNRDQILLIIILYDIRQFGKSVCAIQEPHFKIFWTNQAEFSKSQVSFISFIEDILFVILSICWESLRLKKNVNGIFYRENFVSQNATQSISNCISVLISENIIVHIALLKKVYFYDDLIMR